MENTYLSFFSIIRIHEIQLTNKPNKYWNLSKQLAIVKKYLPENDKIVGMFLVLKTWPDDDLYLLQHLF